MSMLPSILVLGLAALWAVGMTRGRSSPAEYAGQRRRAAAALAVVTELQFVHFLEEAETGLDVQLPGLLGLDAMPRAGFLGFNAAWLVIWVVSVAGVRAGISMAFFAAWFLAIGAMLNGIAHPFLALVERGYFPGLISAPVVGLAGVWLWVRLREATVSSRRVRR